MLLQKTAKNLFHWVIISGLALVAIGQVIFALVSSFWTLFAAMIILALGVGCTLPPVNTLVTGSAETKRRGIVTCLYGTVRFFGVAIGPPAFGFIEKFGKLAVLSISAGIAVVILILSALFIKENKILVQEKDSKGGLQ